MLGEKDARREREDARELDALRDLRAAVLRRTAPKGSILDGLRQLALMAVRRDSIDASLSREG